MIVKFSEWSLTLYSPIRSRKTGIIHLEAWFTKFWNMLGTILMLGNCIMNLIVLNKYNNKSSEFEQASFVLIKI